MLNGSTRKLVKTSQCTFIGEAQSHEVFSCWPSLPTPHQEDQKKHWGEEVHMKVDYFPHFSQGFVDPLLSSANDNLGKLVSGSLEFLTIEVRLVCQVPFPKWCFRLQITDSSNATIDLEIPFLWASSLLVADAHGLGNLPDALPHFIIFPLCYQATLLLANPHGFHCPLADSNTSVLGPDVDLLSRHLDCISICNDWFWQPEGIMLHYTFSTAVNDWVVDTKCSLLWTSVRSIEYIIKGNVMW